MTPFEQAFRFTIHEECWDRAAHRLLDQGITGDPGALVDDPDDHGGRTAYGITQRTFSKYLSDHGLPDRDVWTITADEIRKVYYERYWCPCAQYCPDGLSLAVYDTCVLHGKEYGIPRLQISLGLEGDGVVGPKTRKALGDLFSNPVVLQTVLQDYLQARDDRYEALTGRDKDPATRTIKQQQQIKYYNGWEARLDRLCALVGVTTTDPVLPSR